jgi:tetratricopeptide (TPR) repeat protein
VSLNVKRGWLLALHVREYEQAQADFARAMTAQPQNAEALSGLGYTAACRKSADDAEKYAVQALLQGGGDYLTLHNVACIYARLYRNTPSASPAYQDLAVELLGRDLELWRHGGAQAPNALQLIQADDELRVLDSSPTFQALLRDVRP